MLSFKVDCTNSSNIYFSFYVEDKQVGYMNGVIILQEGKEPDLGLIYSPLTWTLLASSLNLLAIG
jgi:hypothetical protein